MSPGDALCIVFVLRVLANEALAYVWCACGRYQVVPVVSAAMWDTRTEVKKGASDATLKALNTCQNRDIRPFIPAVIEAIKTPTEVRGVFREDGIGGQG